MDDADHAHTLDSGAVKLRLQTAEGFGDGGQAGFDVEIAHGRTGVPSGKIRRLRGFAEGTDGGAGGNLFAAGGAGFHGTEAGSSSSRRRLRIWRKMSAMAIRNVMVSEVGAAMKMPSRPQNRGKIRIKGMKNAQAIGALTEEVAAIETRVDDLVRDLEASIREADAFIVALAPPA